MMSGQQERLPLVNEDPFLTFYFFVITVPTMVAYNISCIISPVSVCTYIHTANTVIILMVYYFFIVPNRITHAMFGTLISLPLL